MSDAPIVTIDGPSGAGKGTISRALAVRLGWHLLDSGALYRLVALAGLTTGLGVDDVDGHVRAATRMHVDFGTGPDGGELIRLDDADVTARVRSEMIGQGASRVASWPALRAALLTRQRDFARLPGLVADGRDMGTVIFPAAPLKVFLTASAAERAERRYKQLKDKGSGVSLAALSREIAERDLRDSTRSAAPLAPAPDAERIDSTGLSIDAVVEQVMAAGRRRSLWA